MRTPDLFVQLRCAKPLRWDAGDDEALVAVSVARMGEPTATASREVEDLTESSCDGKRRQIVLLAWIDPRVALYRAFCERTFREVIGLACQ